MCLNTTDCAADVAECVEGACCNSICELPCNACNPFGQCVNVPAGTEIRCWRSPRCAVPTLRSAWAKPARPAAARRSASPASAPPGPARKALSASPATRPAIARRGPARRSSASERGRALRPSKIDQPEPSGAGSAPTARALPRRGTPVELAEVLRTIDATMFMRSADWLQEALASTETSSCWICAPRPPLLAATSRAACASGSPSSPIAWISSGRAPVRWSASATARSVPPWPSCSCGQQGLQRVQPLGRRLLLGEARAPAHLLDVSLKRPPAAPSPLPSGDRVRHRAHSHVHAGSARATGRLPSPNQAPLDHW